MPVVLTEHRDAGGWGGGHSRSLSVDFLPAAGKPEDLEVREGAALSEALRGELINLAAPPGVRGGFLIGSAETVRAYSPPSDVILARTLDWSMQLGEQLPITSADCKAKHSVMHHVLICCTATI